MNTPVDTASGGRYTRELLEALRARDVGAAERALAAAPAAAAGYGDGGESPLLMAIYAGLDELATRIARLRSLDLSEAAALGDEERIAAILAASPDAALHAHTPDGWTPLHLAAFFGRTAAAARLLDAGAALEARSANYMENTPLCAALAGREDRTLVAMLLDRGADVKARAAQGVTPLHLAASRGAADLVDALLARGADRAARLDDGRTPAAMAAERGHADLARSLADHDG